MNKIEFITQLGLVSMIIFGLLGLGGIMARTAQAGVTQGDTRIDPPVIIGTMPSNKAQQDFDQSNKGKIPEVEDHGVKSLPEAHHATQNNDGSIALS